LGELLSGYALDYVDDLKGQIMSFGSPVSCIDEITWICNLFAVPRAEDSSARWASTLKHAVHRLEGCNGSKHLIRRNSQSSISDRVGFHNALERQRSATCQQLGGSCHAEEKRNRVIHRAWFTVVRTTVNCMTLALASALALGSAVALAQGAAVEVARNKRRYRWRNQKIPYWLKHPLERNTINGTRGVPGSNAHGAASRGHSGKAMRHQ
jgi:hypothetical protein